MEAAGCFKSLLISYFSMAKVSLQSCEAHFLVFFYDQFIHEFEIMLSNNSLLQHAVSLAYEYSRCHFPRLFLQDLFFTKLLCCQIIYFCSILHAIGHRTTNAICPDSIVFQKIIFASAAIFEPAACYTKWMIWA